MTSLPNIASNTLENGQLTAEVLVNEIAARLAMLHQVTLTSYKNNTPPSAPTDGEVHLLGSSPTGAWAGHANTLALYMNGWAFLPPYPMVAYDETNGKWVAYDGTTWTSLSEILTGVDVLPFALFGGSPTNTGAQNVTAWNAASTFISGLTYGATLSFGAGVYEFDAQLDMDQALWGIKGSGMGRTVLKVANATNDTYLLVVGEESSSTQHSEQFIEDITLDGNGANQSSTQRAVLLIRNTTSFRLENVAVRNGYDSNIIETSQGGTGVGSSKTQRAKWNKVWCFGALANGNNVSCEILGAKNSEYVQLSVYNNTGSGLLIGGVGYQDNYETTQCVATQLHVHDNGTDETHHGIIFNNATRWVINGFICNFSTGTGLYFTRTNTSTGHGPNDVKLIGGIVRNNGSHSSCTVSGMASENSGDCNVQMDWVTFQNITTVADQYQIHIQGGTVRLGYLEVKLGPSCGVWLESCNGTAEHLNINNNGQVARVSVDQHGYKGTGGGRFQIDRLTCFGNGSTVSGAGYEFYTGGQNTRVEHLVADAVTSGREVLIDSGDQSIPQPATCFLRNTESYMPSVAVSTSGANVTIPDDAYMLGRMELACTGTPTIDQFSPAKYPGAKMTVHAKGSATSLVLNHNAVTGPGHLLCTTDADISLDPEENSFWMEADADGNWAVFGG